jgi:3-hydroxyisobutyrate dehydrogenase-like beta-hydroxyacid dehydrogenase
VSIKPAPESETGKNGRGLVTKIMIGLAVALAIQTLVAAVILAQWKGGITSDVGNHVQLGGHPAMELRMTAAERAGDIRSERIEAISETLARIERGQEDIKRTLESLLRQGGPP